MALNLPVGIDVSNHQGNINWDAVAAYGIQFAIIKATEGTNYIDPYFQRNWNEAKRVGIRPGAYHYARPSLNGASAEAEFFYKAVTDRVNIESGDLLAQDMEDPNARGDLSGWALFFQQLIETFAGFTPLFYSRTNYIEEHGLGTPELAKSGLWLAQYPVNPVALPKAPVQWPVIAIWQYSEKGRVNGINGNCDMNYFNGPIERLPLYGKPETKKEPEPTPTIDVEAIQAQLNIILAANNMTQEAVAKISDLINTPIFRKLT